MSRVIASEGPSTAGPGSGVPKNRKHDDLNGLERLEGERCDASCN